MVYQTPFGTKPGGTPWTPSGGDGRPPDSPACASRGRPCGPTSPLLARRASREGRPPHPRRRAWLLYQVLVIGTARFPFRGADKTAERKRWACMGGPFVPQMCRPCVSCEDELSREGPRARADEGAVPPPRAPPKSPGLVIGHWSQGGGRSNSPPVHPQPSHP